MNNDGGYVRIYRRVLDDPDFNNVGEAMAFIYLILKAAWKPCKVHYKGKSIDLERGQVAISLRDFAEEFGWSKDKVGRFLTRLKRDSRATVTATGGATGVNVITVCNYDVYQAKSDEGATAGATATFPSRDTEQVRNKTKEDLSNDKSMSETEFEQDDFDSPPPAKPSTDEVDQAVEIWNNASAHYGWPAIRKLNPDRRKKLAARLSEIGGVVEWRGALVRATKGMLGAQPPPTWFSFDWLTTNQTNILKLIEGNYDRKFGDNGNGTGTNNTGAVGNRGVPLGVMADLARKFRDEENAQASAGGGLQLLTGPDAGDGFAAGTG